MTRVLRPGGRAVLTDFTEEAPLTEEEGEIALNGGLVPPLTADAVLEDVRAGGLEIDEVHECGDRIRPSYPEYFKRLGRLRPSLTAVLGEEKVAGQEEAMRHLLPIYRDKIGYLVITGRKPR
jgi:hypothetical protein